MAEIKIIIIIIITFRSTPATTCVNKLLKS